MRRRGMRVNAVGAERGEFWLPRHGCGCGTGQLPVRHGGKDLRVLLEDLQPLGEKHFRVHLDGHNQLPYPTGKFDESPWHEFFNYGEHDLFALSYNNWKAHNSTKRARTTNTNTATSITAWRSIDASGCACVTTLLGGGTSQTREEQGHAARCGCLGARVRWRQSLVRQARATR